ncbi:MAG: methanogenesis marker 2 protein [Methanobacteriota archaeon]|nr:MAG: methanogenesis marker 2 protein [Euryarchaeota archaeon]
MNLTGLVEELRNYGGITRKREISEVVERLLCENAGCVLAALGEDAAAIEHDKTVLLLAADGMMESFVEADPHWAGYCSVLVNVNDIAAMGGMPMAVVDVLSCRKGDVRDALVSGLAAASKKFGVPIVGGHLHPDATHAALDVAVLGETDMDHLVLSTGASVGDDIVCAMDLDGQFTPGIPYSWDTTSTKGREEVRRCLASMHTVAPLLSAGKDISNPGTLGTMGMLLEASSAGGHVDILRIPRPGGVGLGQWLKAYQGCGFVVTCDPGSTEGVAAEFERRGLTASKCGSVAEGHELVVEMQGDRETLFDLSAENFGCRVPQRI